MTLSSGRSLSADSGVVLPSRLADCGGPIMVTRWSFSRERPSGQTFAFAPEIALFLEGFRDMDGGVPAFGHVLHLLYLIGLGDRAGSTSGRTGRLPGTRLPTSFARRDARCGMPARCAQALCADAPRAADPPELCRDPRDPHRRALGAIDRACSSDDRSDAAGRGARAAIRSNSRH